LLRNIAKDNSMDQQSSYAKKIRVEKAIGMSIAHDITEIRPGEFKGVAFKKGHKVEQKDICRLMRLGKKHLYVLDLSIDMVHEDEAAFELARGLSGKNVIYEDSPREGKLRLRAKHDGLLKIDVDSLIEFNMIEDVMCASLHTNIPVKKNQDIAGLRILPLVIKRKILDNAIRVAKRMGPIFTIKKFKPLKVGLLVTGSEIFEGLIEDRFEGIVRKKVEYYGSRLVETLILPDEKTIITKNIEKLLQNNIDIIIATGGMSVDPDDVTRRGIMDAGVERVYYGAAVLPGAMFQLGYSKNVPVIGIPACALYHEITVFDLILPRLLVDERPDGRDLAKLAHGGFCINCDVCRYPACSFGKV